jgi:hypothetical protein
MPNGHDPMSRLKTHNRGRVAALPPAWVASSSVSSVH